MFDIKDFYLSVTKELLDDVLNFVKTIINLIDQDEKVIFHSCKSLHCHQEQTCMKKGDGLLDVSMEVDDGAVVCELIDIILLNLLGRKYDTENIDLYRGDGLSVFQNCSVLQMEKIKKRLQKVFKSTCLDVNIECNIKISSYTTTALTVPTKNR